MGPCHVERMILNGKLFTALLGLAVEWSLEESRVFHDAAVVGLSLGWLCKRWRKDHLLVLCDKVVGWLFCLSLEVRNEVTFLLPFVTGPHLLFYLRALQDILVFDQLWVLWEWYVREVRNLSSAWVVVDAFLLFRQGCWVPRELLLKIVFILYIEFWALGFFGYMSITDRLRSILKAKYLRGDLRVPDLTSL